MKMVLLLAMMCLCSCAAATVYTRFESSPGGARIEINNQYVGRTPFTYKWPGNMYSQFGNFTDETSIRAYPSGPNQYQQRKYFESHHGELPKIPKSLSKLIRNKTAGMSGGLLGIVDRTSRRVRKHGSACPIVKLRQVCAYAKIFGY